MSTVSGTAKPTWEYREFPCYIDDGAVQMALNALGKEGWELVCIASGRVFLKRQLGWRDG